MCALPFAVPWLGLPGLTITAAPDSPTVVSIDVVHVQTRPKSVLELLDTRVGDEFDALRWEDQFRGDHMWLANLEVRPTLIERQLWALQGNVFADLSKTWDA